MVHYTDDDRDLSAQVYLTMANRVWPGQYDEGLMQRALERTINVTAWDGGALVGCVRVLTDGYLFGTVTELLVLEEYRNRGIGRELMRRAAQVSPTSLFFGAQPGAVGFYEKLGAEKSLQSFVIKKQRK